MFCRSLWQETLVFILHLRSVEEFGAYLAFVLTSKQNLTHPEQDLVRLGLMNSVSYLSSKTQEESLSNMQTYVARINLLI